MIGPLGYVGGKRRLAPTIIKLLPTHTTYVEPFAGGAQVLFHKPPSKVEVLNDLDDEIVNFLKVCQHHHEELLRWLRWTTASRKLFAVFSLQPPEILTDVQRAARFLYLQKNTFGGLRHKRIFGYTVASKARYVFERLPARIQSTAERLQRVQLECLSYEQVLKRYDRTTTLFYCDPPYHGPQLYKYNFSDTDFATLAENLAAIQGQFLLSLNDTPVIRELFGRFQMREVGLYYSNSRGGSHVTELLIANYSLPEHIPAP